jgi:hypothetical protein
MNKEEIKVLSAVESIYYEWDVVSDEIQNPEVVMDGSCVIVKYLGMIIWCSENDDRKFDEVRNRYENIGCFLRKKINEINRKVGAILISEVADE